MRAAFLLVLMLAAPVAVLPAASAAAAADGAASTELYRQVRRAVTDGDDETLYNLARDDPWGFREVVNQLSDLVVQQGGREKAADAFTRLVVAGHLAAVHLQITGDKTLAQRIRGMLSWTGFDMADRAEVDDLLARVEAPSPPSPQKLEKGLPVCERLADDRCLGLVRAGVGRVHERSGHLDLAALWYERAVDAFRRAGELQRLRNAFLSSGQVLLQLDQAAAAAEPLGAAAAVSDQIGDDEGRAGSLILLGEALARSGRRGPAFEALGESRRIALARDLPLIAARAILLRAVLRDQDSSKALSAEDYLAAARLAQKAGDLPTVVEAYGRAAQVLLRTQETARAAEVIDKGLAAARLGGSDSERQTMLLMAAELDAQLGDYDRSISRLREALEIARRVGKPLHIARVLEILGITLLESGRINAAVGPLQEAVSAARQAGDAGIEGRAEGGLGAVARARSRFGEAATHYARSAELLEATGDTLQSLRMKRLGQEMQSRAQSSAGS